VARTFPPRSFSILASWAESITRSRKKCARRWRYHRELQEIISLLGIDKPSTDDRLAGGIRNQFAHFIDVVPTLLEVAGIPQPTMVDGVKQKPIEGVSLAYTFAKANADSPSRHHTQYFEMFADRTLYHDGWIASTKVTRPPWQLVSAVNTDPANNVTWELYNLTKDWTQDDDVASKFPAN
jgi:arylsulfatase A-like enzyme